MASHIESGQTFNPFHELALFSFEDSQHFSYDHVDEFVGNACMAMCIPTSILKSSTRNSNRKGLSVSWSSEVSTFRENLHNDFDC